MRFILLSIIVFLTCSCEKKNDAAVIKQEINSEKNIDFSELIPEARVPSKEENLRNLNDEILQLLKAKNYQKLASYIHPEKGLRFSMYAYVLPEKDKTFSKANFEKYINSNIKFTFGERDGSGEIYITTLKSYLENWVFKRDFTAAEYYLNEFKGHGNSLNNLIEIYPENDFTENHIKGSEQYGGMDWNSLRLVFEEFEGKNFLVAIVNDEWTI